MQTYTSSSKTGGRRQNSYSTQYSHTYQESGNKAQVCQSMGWEGSQDIPQHGRQDKKTV